MSNGRVGCKRDSHPVRYRSGSYFFEDGVGSAGLLATGVELSAGFADSVAEELPDFELPAPDDPRP
ncbi:MAG TPA: hypothetical protein VMW54_00585 [Terriglobia bacterium]|nr:hypothetical protein [Terriglobia bacterium]